MKLPKIDELKVDKRHVLLRADLDVGKGEEDKFRLNTQIETISYLLNNKAKLIIIGHKGRPSETKEEEFSLRQVSKELSKLLKIDIKFIDNIDGQQERSEIENMQGGSIIMFENLRFNKGEEENNQEYAKQLADFADIYVNEAFAASHRNHASIVSLPIRLKQKSENSLALGFHFQKEIDNLGKVLNLADNQENKGKVVYIISGIKKDKLDYIEPLLKRADKILIGGRLPEYIPEDKRDVPVSLQNSKLIVAKLLPDKEDITLHSIEKFEEEIKDAATIVISGPIGKFEDQGHSQGTQRVYQAVVHSNAFKVAGGGETQKAISMFNLNNKFDWISVGGGAMLEFLAKETLPGLDALLN